jgi:hypothetical protein
VRAAFPKESPHLAQPLLKTFYRLNVVDDFRFWPSADIEGCPPNVGYRGAKRTFGQPLGSLASFSVS